MAGRTYGIGIIGAGHIGRAHVKTWRECPRAEVRAVVDVIPGRAPVVAHEFKIPSAYTDYAPVLERHDIDLVAVCTPPYAHYQPTVDALQAGKAVLCEKPFALQVGEAERMVAAARASGQHLAVASARFRYGAASCKAKEMIAAGALGRVYYGRASLFRQRGRPGIDLLKDATWFLSKGHAGGGALIDIGVYEIDLMLWLMGNPRVLSVSATTWQGIGDPRPDGMVQNVEDHATVMCQLEGGAAFALEVAWASHIQDQHVRLILGDRGGLQFGPLTFFGPPVAVGRDCLSRRVLGKGVGDGAGGGLPGIARAFITALDGGPAPMTPAEEALVVTRVIDAAYCSAATGRPVVL
ncbi:MAG: Gfo/Idh/MocA family oxidoreductase [Armatimonadetes bacterium]|nr:Gfo/Idh/MocA family oxidoreductase [Armatimonadota bacterium]